MKAVDTTILIYARRGESPHHSQAVNLLQSLATGSEPWVLPWPCVYEFLRVVTHPRVFRPPTPLGEAWKAVGLLLDSPSIVPIAEGDRHRQIIADLLGRTPVTGNALHDAHIAALLIEHGIQEILTADEDFRRFVTLKVTNPFRSY